MVLQVEILNCPFCFDCGIKLEQIDALIGRIDGLYATFGLLLTCAVCFMKRKEILMPKDVKLSPKSETTELLEHTVNYSDSDHSNSQINELHHNDIAEEKIVTEPSVTKSLPKNEFICDPCGKKFQTKTTLFRHMSKQHSKSTAGAASVSRLRHCRICLEYFARPKLRELHEKTAHLIAATNAYQCPVCAFTNLSLDTVIEHRAEHNQWKCPVCGVAKSLFAQFCQHFHCHRRIDRVSIRDCVVCDKSFALRKDLKRHELSSHTNPVTSMYRCPECAFETKYRRLIRDHIIEHTGRMPYICDVCGCGHSSERLLKNHIKREHINAPKYQCSICRKVCNQKSALDRHELVHTDKRPLKCTMCEKTYRDATDLRRHKRTHGLEEPKLACDKCDKRFYEPKQLRNHKRVYRH